MALIQPIGLKGYRLIDSAKIDHIIGIINGTSATGFGGMFPNATNTYDLGTSVLKWKDLYLAGNGTIGGTLGVTGVITPTAGVAAAGGFTVLPSNWHTGAICAQVAGDGNDTTPVNTETYICAVFVPANATLTGVRTFNGSVASGNIFLALANSAGVVVAATASTAMSGTDAYQQVAFTAPYAVKGPATYYVLQQVDNGTARINTHAFGSFPASKKTGETYGTFTTITAPTTFTANQGPMATLY